MGWLEDGIEYYNAYCERKMADEMKKKRWLVVRTPEDADFDCSQVASVRITRDIGKEVPIVELISGIINKAPNLEQLSIYGDLIDWKSLCSLDLSGIKRLYVSIADQPREGILVAPCLQELDLSGTNKLGPLELAAETPIWIDFSMMPKLEELILRHVQPLDPLCFSHLADLRNLSISYSGICALNWLKNADYQLERLSIEDAIYDCSGIECQQELREVWLQDTYIRDVDPITRLQKIMYLNLVRSSLQPDAESILKSRGIQTALITRKDAEIQSIRESVRNLVERSARDIYNENKQLENANELPESQGKTIVRRCRQSFERRLRNHVISYYEGHKNRIEESKHISRFITKEEYLEIYQKAAEEYYPFLAENEEENKKTNSTGNNIFMERFVLRIEQERLKRARRRK